MAQPFSAITASSHELQISATNSGLTGRVQPRNNHGKFSTSRHLSSGFRQRFQGTHGPKVRCLPRKMGGAAVMASVNQPNPAGRVPAEGGAGGRAARFASEAVKAATDAAVLTTNLEEADHTTAGLPAPRSMAEPHIAREDESVNQVLETDPLAPHAGWTEVKRKVFTKSTHVVCTLGPATNTVEKIMELLDAGMSVARLNFSHGDHAYHLDTLNKLREASRRAGNQLCAVLLDTKGPEIRTGYLRDGGPITYEEGSIVTIHADYTLKGDEHNLALSYPKFPDLAQVGGSVLMADGTLIMQIEAVDPQKRTVTCRCLNTATIGERKNCNLPGVAVDLPVLTSKDEDDLRWAVTNHVDFVAVSFVRSANDVRIVRRALGDEGKGIRIISKIENQEGLANIDEIIAASDGVMVARGDLGMEINLEQMFRVQKMIIHKCNEAGKPVVTATQMLESMIKNPRPTRAEATDVANAVLDGTDCVMLSGETAAGAHAKKAVQIMSSICEEAEKAVDNYAISERLLRQQVNAGHKMKVIEALASSVVTTATKIHSPLIVVLAANGQAARLIAKYRPAMPVVVGCVPRNTTYKNIGFKDLTYKEDQVARQLLLTRGLIPVMLDGKDTKLSAAEAAKQCVDEAIKWAKSQGLCQEGDDIVTMYNVKSQCAVIRVVPCP